MTQRLGILLSLLLLSTVAGLAWALFGASEPPISDLAQEALAAETAPASRAIAAEPAPELPATPTSRVAAPTATPAGAEPPPIPADATWVEVRVADQASGRPVAGAEVAWLDASLYQRLRMPAEDAQWMYQDVEPIAHAYGWRARTDQDGMVRVHVSDWTSVYARAGSRYGSVSCNKKTLPAEGYRIELVEDRNLQVQVLDALGRPAAGVRIAVAQHGADGAFLRLWTGMPLARTEKPDGKARIAHMQCWQEHPHGGEVLVPTAQWRVRAELPGGKDPGVVFDPKAPPAETVVLRLPPTGTVTARVEVGGGRVLTGTRRTIEVHVGPPGDRHTRNRAWQKPIGPDGCARFPWVPVGGTLAASTRLDTSFFHKEFAAPAAQGEEVTVVLTPSPDDVALTGRILDDRQQLLRDTELFVQYKTVRSQASTRLQTDSEGRFLVFLGAAKGTRLETFAVERRSTDGPALRATIEPRPLEPGVHDVGDLVLRAGPLAVSGRFMEGEKPYERHVGFVVERKQSGDIRNPRELGAGMVVQAGRVRGRWEQVQGLTTTQNPPGTFEVRGETGPGQYRIRFHAWDHLPVEPIEFVPGARDLTVQIVRGAQLVATVLLPPDLPWGLQGLLQPDQPRAVSAPGDDDPLQSRPDRLRVESMEEQPPGRHTLRWHALPPQTYTLDLRLWGVPGPLLSIPDVSVPLPDGDRRLEDIDLRTKVTALTVRALDPTGKPPASTVHNACVFVHPLDPTADWSGYQLLSGAVRMAVPPGPVDLLVVVDGFRPKEVRGARGEVEVTLEAWPEIELVFPDLPELPDGQALHVMLRGADAGSRARYTAKSGRGGSTSGGRNSFFQPRTSDTTVQKGRLTLPIGDGPQRLTVWLSGGPGRGRVLAGVTPAEVSAGSTPIEVRIPAEALAKALAEQKAPTGR
jgi:hypothetical protein